jgi:hypothetical protein
VCAKWGATGRRSAETPPEARYALHRNRDNAQGRDEALPRVRREDGGGNECWDTLSIPACMQGCCQLQGA